MLSGLSPWAPGLEAGGKTVWRNLVANFRCPRQQKGLPSHRPRPARPATPEPQLVTRNNSAAEKDINVNLLAWWPDLLPRLEQQAGDDIQEATLL